MSRKNLFAALLILTSGAFAAAAEPVSPWGVCAHIQKGYEYENIDKEIKLMKEAGISSVRFDFQFSHAAAKKGEYRFDRYEEVVGKLHAAGIEVLPILSAYEWEISKPRPDVTPMHKHPEAWREFVRETGARFKGKLKVWEIWNEQDGGFWKPNPNAAEYVPLLKIAYEELKKIDPENRVMVGGLCGWAVDYLDDMYRAGAKGYFDLIAVHPYGWGIDKSATRAKEMAEFKAVMAKNGDAAKPVWITEAGGPSHRSNLITQQPDAFLKAIDYALREIKSPAAGKPLTVAGAPKSLRSKYAEAATDRAWLPGVEIKSLSPEEMAKADPATLPVIIGCESVHLEEPYLKPMVDYISRGGLLLAFGEVPMYTVNYQNRAGNWTRKGGDDAMKQFRIAFEAWWTKKGLPRQTMMVETLPEMEKTGLKQYKNIYTTRFLSGKNMNPGDSYTPMVNAVNAQQEVLGQAMALYRYADRKGAILGCTMSFASGFTEAEQANLIQRVYLSYLSAGVEKVFAYNFHCDGTLTSEKEHNFGLVRWNFQPKPSYRAYRAMTEKLGAKPVFVERLKTAPEVWSLVFRRAEDGKKVVATWNTAAGDGKVAFSELP